MIHVGMNIEHKTNLFSELAHVLEPGAFLAIYDLMRIGSGDINFPVPWASTFRCSFVDSQDKYLRALNQAGLQTIRVTNRNAYALEFFNQMQTKLAETGPDPLGIQLLMGDAAYIKLSNAYGAMEKVIIAPVEIIVQKSK